MLENIKNCGIGKFVSRGSWIHGERTIDSYEIIFVTKGDVYINEARVEYHVKPYEFLLLEPNLCHFGYKHSTDTEFFWFHWYGDVKAIRRLKYGKIENPYSLIFYLRQMITARIMQKGEKYIDCLTSLVLQEIGFASGYRNSGLSIPVIEKAAAWIRANCCGEITEAQVAEYCQYSTDYLNRLFKSVYSQTIKQYINGKRMEYIKELMLCDNVPLKELASQAGFSEYKYFLKFFKYHEKITPTEFYKQYAYQHINSR